MRRPFQKRNKSPIGIVVGGDDSLCVNGYVPLDKNPEIVAACHTIATLIGSITIHLMKNTEDGDVRIVNELSRKIDIDPMPNMTRSQWMESIVMTMLLYGKGNAIVLPHTQRGYLEELEPIAASRVNFQSQGYSDYTVTIDGRRFTPDEVLHFAYNPDKNYLWKGQGVTVSLQELAHNLKQAEVTKRGFLESKWKPSIIIKVDAMDSSFDTPAKRDKLLSQYVESDTVGKPWIVPAEQFDIQTIKPLSLADLAISDTVEIDKRTVAALLGVPPFVVGVGEYNQKAWNNFIDTRVRPITLNIAQEMTKKLILSPDWYLRFNVLSLLDWDIQTVSNVLLSASDRGFITGNEYRDRIGMSPKEGLNELRVLENYIPTDMAGLQKKLIQEEDK